MLIRKLIIFADTKLDATIMLDYDDFDFQEQMEEERELSQQPKPSPQGNGVPAGAIVGGIVAVVIIVLCTLQANRRFRICLSARRSAVL